MASPLPHPRRPGACTAKPKEHTRLAKPNYGFEKRQRELAKKKKQDEKDARKREARAAAAATPAPPEPEAPAAPETTPDASAPRIHRRVSGEDGGTA